LLVHVHVVVIVLMVSLDGCGAMVVVMVVVVCCLCCVHVCRVGSSVLLPLLVVDGDGVAEVVVLF
jgi:hypothetical protein